MAESEPRANNAKKTVSLHKKVHQPTDQGRDYFTSTPSPAHPDDANQPPGTLHTHDGQGAPADVTSPVVVVPHQHPRGKATLKPPPMISHHPNPFIKAILIVLRGMLMAIYFILFEIMNYVIFAIAAVQFLFLLFTGYPIKRLVRFNEVLSAYMGDIVAYLTCVQDRPPFPFSRFRRERGEPL